MSRKIEWDAGTVQATKERASAVAWAFHRLGRKAWVGKNVTQAITDYLVENGYNVDRSKVRSVMIKLVRENYAYERHSENKRSIVEFGFLPDVDLSGHGLPKKEATKMTTNQGVKELEKIKATVHDQSVPHALPPIPAMPEPEPYLLEKLNKLLRNWAGKDPESYAGWVDQAVDSLETNT